ncbi:DUF1642 domain-containing protein [Enterococcus faecalis]|uniref:DUF1642 domain-containing protein n=1 Tax=Enterococcus faecalis TaxID=1351 RepID=UPI001EE3BEDE|nr:DUF1642 domain-containing protein [Enterococcus faecalis]UKV08005.1 DUF1642 domain-containing protein [Enterococcus faecalis]
MNKQELIDILENLECSTESLSYDNGYEQGVYDSLSHVILLDEPKKVVVPKFVAEWIEYAKKKGVSLIVSFNPWDLYGAEYIEATRWIDNNQETFSLAWVNGYEVEKEQLYYVKLPEIGYMRFGKKYFYSTDKEDAKRYTENQIKAIDERYWPFAVKVDGE